MGIYINHNYKINILFFTTNFYNNCVDSIMWLGNQFVLF